MPTHLRRHDESGHVHFLTISCYHRMPFFGTIKTRDLVVRCMSDSRIRLGFRWIGYIIMPEHVHWLIYPQATGDAPVISISTVLESLKTSIGKRVKAAWRNVWRQHCTLGHPGLDRWATAQTDRKPIWTTRGIDFNVTTYDRLIQKLEYMHDNPVTRGLVARPEEWRWSSFRHYNGGGEVLLRMDWDGGWPLD